MLLLRCGTCRDILFDPEDKPLLLPCSHVYCSKCWHNMSQVSSGFVKCSLCRTLHPPSAALRIQAEHREADIPPLPEVTVELLQSFVERSCNIDQDSSKAKVQQTVVCGEKLLTELLKSHEDTPAKKHLDSLCTTLEDLRKRLKLFTRIHSMQQELDSQEEIVKHLTVENDSLQSELIAERVKSDSLKSQFKSWSTQAETELKQHRAKIKELDEQLTKERMRSCKYEKKYRISHQKAKLARNPVHTDPDHVDQSLEIIPS